MIKPMELYDGFNVTFQTTEDCNLRCSYCYEVSKRRSDLPMERAKRFVDMLLGDLSPLGLAGTRDQWVLERGIILDFIGGDSMMRPGLIDGIISYFQFAATLSNHRWAHRWRASVSTNGTLFGDPAVRALMEKYRRCMSVSVSVDGCPELHDMNRVFNDGRGSMSEIMKWWGWYVGWAGDSATTKSTLSRASIPYVAESVRFLHEELGLKYINMNFVFEDMGLDDDDYAALDDQLGQTAEYVLAHRDDLYLSMLSREFGCGDSMCASCADRDSGWCGGGAMPCVSPSGDIYPCFRFSSATMTEGVQELKLGHVDTGWADNGVLRLIRSQTRAKISPPECADCPVETNCAWCIGGEYSRTGKFSRGTSLCGVRKLTAKWADEYWRRYDKEKKK